MNRTTQNKMTEEGTIHVALGFDHNFVMPIGILLISICENTNACIVFHALISDSVTERDKEELSTIVKNYKQQICYYDISKDQFRNLHESHHIRRSTYNRLLIPDLLPNYIKKVIYLDGDIVVVNSLESLWNIDIAEDCPLAASIDPRCSGVVQHNAIDIPLSQLYYNAGVLVMNIDYWRKSDLASQIINYIEESHCPWHDQDGINHVIGRKIKKLHLRYNLQMDFVRHDEMQWQVEKEKFFQEVYEAKANPVIIHYSESSKPWHDDYPFPEEWLKYKAMSPWKDEPLVAKPKKADYTRTLISELEQTNFDSLNYYAPTYFVFMKTVANKHKWLLWLSNKVLWCVIRLFR